MLGSTLLLTLATLAGLLAGFAREWLLVAAWGAGSRSDAFLVAVFIPEALRMTLAAGILAAAALPLYQERDAQRQHAWLAGLCPRLLGLGLGLYALLALSAPLWTRLIGPGLDSAVQAEAAANLRSLAACIPACSCMRCSAFRCTPGNVLSCRGWARCCSTCHRCFICFSTARRAWAPAFRWRFFLAAC
ncbi:hypothetical protein TRE132_55710 [Pseudomonas chlororaphis subsp. aurantiaca]|nr:hypothetical protein TRE132_55710 [Pseudomonas chlororaphis subsp. aurantiaca]